jgi:hypothetical protein
MGGILSGKPNFFTLGHKGILVPERFYWTIFEQCYACRCRGRRYPLKAPSVGGTLSTLIHSIAASDYRHCSEKAWEGIFYEIEGNVAHTATRPIWEQLLTLNSLPDAHVTTGITAGCT